jgi:arylsulfatase
VAEGRVERTTPFRMSIDETLDIGEDTGTPVSEDYTVPFVFHGGLKRVLIRIGEAALSAEDEAQVQRARAMMGVAQ